MINNLQQFTSDFLLLGVNINILVISIIDKTNKDPVNKTRVFLCELIISCSLIFSFLPLIFLLPKMAIVGFEFYKAKCIPSLPEVKKSTLASAPTKKLDSTQLIDFETSFQKAGISQNQELFHNGLSHTYQIKNRGHVKINGNNEEKLGNTAGIRRLKPQKIIRAPLEIKQDNPKIKISEVENFHKVNQLYNEDAKQIKQKNAVTNLEDFVSPKKTANESQDFIDMSITHFDSSFEITKIHSKKYNK